MHFKRHEALFISVDRWEFNIIQIIKILNVRKKNLTSTNNLDNVKELKSLLFSLILLFSFGRNL